jgi:hypothetical protein
MTFRFKQDLENFADSIDELIYEILGLIKIFLLKMTFFDKTKRKNKKIDLVQNNIAQCFVINDIIDESVKKTITIL